MMRSLILIILLSSVFVLITIFSLSSSAVDITVGDTGDYQYIQDAVNNSNNGDTIYVWAGTYVEEPDINRSINVIGNSSSNVTVQGSDTSGHDTITISSDWVNISNVHAGWNTNNLDFGIRIKNDNITVSDCNFSDAYGGIQLYDTVELFFEGHTFQVEYDPRTNENLKMKKVI